MNGVSAVWATGGGDYRCKDYLCQGSQVTTGLVRLGDAIHGGRYTSVAAHKDVNAPGVVLEGGLGGSEEWGDSVRVGGRGVTRGL